MISLHSKCFIFVIASLEKLKEHVDSHTMHLLMDYKTYSIEFDHHLLPLAAFMKSLP